MLVSKLLYLECFTLSSDSNSKHYMQSDKKNTQLGNSIHTFRMDGKWITRHTEETKKKKLSTSNYSDHFVNPDYINTRYSLI